MGMFEMVLDFNYYYYSCYSPLWALYERNTATRTESVLVYVRRVENSKSPGEKRRRQESPTEAKRKSSGAKDKGPAMDVKTKARLRANKEEEEGPATGK